MIPIAELRDKYQGRPAAILGGGPSLGRDFLQVAAMDEADGYPPVWIAVNNHALSLVDADVMVFWDDPSRSQVMREAVGGFKGVKVSPLAAWSDVDLSGEEWWRGRFSSHLATWLGCWMGCEPVLLCGMDCYQNPRPVEADVRDYAYRMPLEEHLESWREALVKCPNAGRIKAVSGPLVEVFGRWGGDCFGGRTPPRNDTKETTLDKPVNRV